jgi:hypothetical protein
MSVCDILTFDVKCNNIIAEELRFEELVVVQ